MMDRLCLLTCIRHTAEELSEEDQQLKNELDMLVERLGVRRELFITNSRKQSF